MGEITRTYRVPIGDVNRNSNIETLSCRHYEGNMKVVIRAVGKLMLVSIRAFR
jgi:hypothetical protein